MPVSREQEIESAAEPRPLASDLGENLKKLRFLFLSLGVILLDQWTKWLVEIHLPHHAVEPLIPGLLNLTHVRNTGVAFGLFATSTGQESGSWILTLLGLAALAAVGLYFWFAPSRNRGLMIALALVVGGAVGNLIDRFTSGAVTDFIDVFVGLHHWPSFNVADSAISIGIVLMAIDSFRSHKHAEPEMEPVAAGE